MMLKLKCQYFGHLMRRVDSLDKTLMLGGIGGRREGRDPHLTPGGLTGAQRRQTPTWVTEDRENFACREPPREIPP